MTLGDILFQLLFTCVLILSVVGLIYFDSFVEKYIAFMDSLNPHNISYPKGAYLRFVLKTTLIIAVFIGLIVTTNLFLYMLGTSISELLGGI